MLYNVRIFGKRYRSKTKDDIYILLDKFASDINKTEFHTVDKIKKEIMYLRDSVRRYALFDGGRVIISFNRVKQRG